MAQILINCTRISTREELHQVFSEALHFPSWYGKNLDALRDCLTVMSGTVRLEGWDEAEARLGKYGAAAKKAITSAGFENPHLEIIL